ncbi:probable transmembrane reductase CYB561D1 isoform X2 [Periophthalmus magnuspinnatus]|uniref:probable transmembrane reductase CYB561D1 isoform X2 n=1 Tax=Periophthalmus magnuspinnatus TaxID=409849 RepID=UPI00145A1781|nr:probable transmembrane reductase CYB561D1 isoform X2 [Periophthalmus magnuspinnatus]
MPADVEYSPVGKGLEMQESRLYVWMRRVAVIAAHATGLGLVVTIFVLSRPGTSLFSWHPVCMSVAAAELVFAITGLGFMVASKNRSELPHLVSWHSVLGLCTLVVTALQAACGLCVHFPKQQQILLYPSKLKLYHTTLGLVVYFLATVTILSAMFSDWFQATVRGVGWWALLLLPLLPALVVMNQIINSHLPHKKITI